MWKRKGNTDEKGVKPEDFTGGQETGMSDEEFEKHIDDIMSGEDKASAGEPFAVFQTKDDYLRHMEQKLAENPGEDDGIRKNYELLIGYLKDYYGVQTDVEAIRFLEKQLKDKKEKDGEAEKSCQSKEKCEGQDKKPEQPAASQDEASVTDAVIKLRNRLFGEEALIRREDPAFDLKALYEGDPKFKAYLDNTGSVFYAYIRYKNARAAEVPAAVQTTPQPAQSKPQPARPMQQAGIRSYNEVGAVPGSSVGRVKTSPAKLPDADFDAYIRKIMGDQ